MKNRYQYGLFCLCWVILLIWYILLIIYNNALKRLILIKKNSIIHFDIKIICFIFAISINKKNVQWVHFLYSDNTMISELQKISNNKHNYSINSVKTSKKILNDIERKEFIDKNNNFITDIRK